MRKAEYNFFALKRQLELKTGRPYTWKEIADRALIHRNTMLNLANNRSARVDLDVLMRLESFFNTEGLPVTLCDLFVVTDTTTNQTVNQPKG